MRPFVITFCAAAALLAGCEGDTVRISKSVDDGDGARVLRVVETLQCPDTVGPLTRKGSAQAGGTVCTYGGPRGAEVSLHLVALDGNSPDDAVQAFETQLMADMPQTAARMRAGTPEAQAAAQVALAEADAARAGADVALAEADRAMSEADRAAAEAGGGDAASNENARVRMPGLSVDADDDRARVRLPGISIDADGANARVRIGGMTIDADENSSNVSVSSEDESVSVQARDDAAEIRTRSQGPSTRVTYILTDRTPSDAGWQMVGYEARGPQGGPIVVATVRTKDRDDDSIFDAAKELVTLNVGE